MKSLISSDLSCQRPYHAECTGSRPITEVKQHRASSVLGWVTAWEHGVLLANQLFFLLFSIYTDILRRKVVSTCFFIGEIHNSTSLVKISVWNMGFFSNATQDMTVTLLFTWNFKTLHLTIFWIFFDPIKKNRTFRGAERTQSSLKTSLIHTLIFSH